MVSWKKAAIIWAALSTALAWAAIAEEKTDINPLLLQKDVVKTSTMKALSADRVKNELWKMKVIVSSNTSFPSEDSFESKAPNFDEYYNEIELNFWEDIAEIFRENAEYFVSIVQKDSWDYILGYLTAVFNNPWKERTFNRFVKKLEKNLEFWKEINQSKLWKLHWILEKVWEALDWEIEEIKLALASQDEIIKADEIKIRNFKKQILELEKQIQSDKEQIESNKEQI